MFDLSQNLGQIAKTLAKADAMTTEVRSVVTTNAQSLKKETESAVVSNAFDAAVSLVDLGGNLLGLSDAASTAACVVGGAGDALCAAASVASTAADVVSTAAAVADTASTVVDVASAAVSVTTTAAGLVVGC